MVLSFSSNTHSFIHDKSKSISQFISGRSRYLKKKILKYLSRLVTSTFKPGTGGCGSGSGRGG